MIRLQKLTIEEFRGIRKLELDLGGKTFGIAGPNGTGKSGIVDAIEFALTGDITRLSGYGTSGVSVKSHAPHVDCSDSPDKAKVVLTLATAGGQVITVERTVRAPADPILNPRSPKHVALLADLAAHPEFALSRREIVKYILTPPGQRSKDVQILLRLEQLEKVRQSLQRLANSCKDKDEAADHSLGQARLELQQALGITKFSADNVLTSVNARRLTLQLSALTELTSQSELLTVAPPSNAASLAHRIPKSEALADVRRVLDEAQNNQFADCQPQIGRAVEILSRLMRRPDDLRHFKSQILVTQGIDLLDSDACPLCDVTWSQVELRKHLQEKLAKAREAAGLLQDLKSAVLHITQAVKGREDLLQRLSEYSSTLAPQLDHPSIARERLNLSNYRTALESIASAPTDLQAEIEVLSRKWWGLPDDAIAETSTLENRLRSLPDPTKEEEARSFLTIAQDRYARYGDQRKASEAAQRNRILADRVLEHYTSSSTLVLEKIYKAVEVDFTDFYRLINHDDEKEFEGQLKPSVGKLGFDVDFYGRGKFPPGAYHSEGHQDGMGLCLYLALMKHTLGDNFTFAVLDDVLMSIDAGHRKEVCRLLKRKFPKTQFVVTTHDPVWLQYMRTEQFIQSSVSFGGWDVATGPKVWHDKEVWEQISEELERNDIPKAAGVLRRYLEYVSGLLADRLGAEVRFHGNGQYDLGDLMPPVIRQWKALVAKGVQASKSWNNADLEHLLDMEKTAKERIARSQAEQWAINKALHFNEWATLQRSEMAAVVLAFKELLEIMRCTHCEAFAYISPSRGPVEVLKCDCGRLNLNLKAN